MKLVQFRLVQFSFTIGQLVDLAAGRIGKNIMYWKVDDLCSVKEAWPFWDEWEKPVDSHFLGSMDLQITVLDINDKENVPKNLKTSVVWNMTLCA